MSSHPLWIVLGAASLLGSQRLARAHEDVRNDLALCPSRCRCDGLVIRCAPIGEEWAKSRLVPYYVRGQPAGLKVYAAPPASLARAGLRKGDLITKMNDGPVRTASDFLRAFARLPCGDTTLEVERGGTNAVIRVPARTPAAP